MSTCIYVTHPHPDVLSDSSKVARYTQDQAIRVRSFILKRQGDQIKLERVRTAGGLLCIFIGFARLLWLAGIMSSVFYVRRASTLISTLTTAESSCH